MTDETLSPLIISLQVSGLATVITFFVGIALAWGVLQIRSRFASTAADAIITLPLVLPNARHGILAGLVLSFARALGEFGATIMFAGNIPRHTQTMSTAIYAAVQANDYDLAFRWAIVISLFSLVFIGAMNLYLKSEVR